MDGRPVDDDTGQDLSARRATVLISVKMWVFTFAAISAIGDANGTAASTSPPTPFVLLGSAHIWPSSRPPPFFPQRSAAFLDGSLRWLRDLAAG